MIRFLLKNKIRFFLFIGFKYFCFDFFYVSEVLMYYGYVKEIRSFEGFDFLGKYIMIIFIV